MRNYTFGTLLAVFSLHCNNIGFVDKAKAVANNEFGVVVFTMNVTTTGGAFLQPAASVFYSSCTGLSGITKANCYCQAEANGNGYSGTYKAWLSLSGSVDAICNIQGIESQNCSASSSLGPFIAKIGNGYSILAENYTELSSTGFRTALRSIPQLVFTGTNIDGRSSGSDCTNFTVADTTVPTMGDRSLSGSGFTSTSVGLNCTSLVGSLLCMKQTK